MKEHSDNLDCTQFVLTSSECRVHHGPREVVVIGPKVPIGVERYHSRAVAEPHFASFTEAPPAISALA